MDTEKNKKKSDRTELLGLMTGEQSSLVLYDTLQSKNYTSFCRLLKAGYALNAFILNCIIDFGFENKLMTALNICQRYQYDVYDFLCIYLGRVKAEEYFLNEFVEKKRWEKLILEKISDEALVRHKVWDILIEQKKYSVLLSQCPDMLADASKKDPDGVKECLLKEGAFDLLIKLYGKGALNTPKYSAARKKLWDMHEWQYVLAWDDGALLDINITGQAELNFVFDFILEHGGLHDLYLCYKRCCLNERSLQIEQYLFKKGKVQLFVADKKWFVLFKNGYGHLVDLDDWWTFCNTSKFGRLNVEACAVQQKNWDFLENKGCLKTLFKHFHWVRWYRAFCNSKA